MAVINCAACGAPRPASVPPAHVYGQPWYCSAPCEEAHRPIYKLVSGLKARESPGAKQAANTDSEGPLLFSARDIADAARSLLREADKKPAAPSGSAAEQRRILHELADNAAARQEASTAARSGAALQDAKALRELQTASSQAEAEEAWAAQEAAGALQLPRLHALIPCEIGEEQDYEHLVQCIQSICKQWRAPPEHSLVSWHASDEELRQKVRALMRDFTKAVEDAGPRIAFSEGATRAVRCRVTSVEQAAALPVGEHVRRLLDLVPKTESSWVLLCDQDSLWHPGRTAFFRNFSRQVPGAEKCISAVAPLLARPSKAAAGEAFASALEVNKLLQQGSDSVLVKEELAELSQYCVRRSLLGDFFAAHGPKVLGHELCLTRLLSFVARDHGPKCLQVAPEQFRNATGAPMWMIFCRRASALPRRPAAASEEDEALSAEAPAAISAGRSCEELAAEIAKVRREVDYQVLRQWSNKTAEGIAELVLESSELEAGEEGAWKEWLGALAQTLAARSIEAFAVPQC